jgi:hypothetical protein
MSYDARILARSCFEAVFYLGALNKDPAFLKSLVGDDEARWRKTARAQIKDVSRLMPEEIELIQRVLDREISSNGENLIQVGLEQAAKIAGLSKQYDIF